MVRFVVSPDIQRIINDYNMTKKLLGGDSGYINPESMSIEHLQLVHIASALQAVAEPANKPRYSISHILKTASLYIEPIQKPKPVNLPRLSTLMSESRVSNENGTTSTAA